MLSWHNSKIAIKLRPFKRKPNITIKLFLHYLDDISPDAVIKIFN